MPTYTATDAEAIVRQFLLYPEGEKPNRVQIWHALNANAQRMLLNAQNTRVGWEVATWPLIVGSGTRDYLITAGDFGKDICIYTKESNVPYHQPREIERVELQDINFYYQGPAQATGSGHTAACMSFYRQNGTPYVRVTPTPAASAEYEITYQRDSGVFGSGSDVFIFAPFNYLLAAETALQLLPACQWAELDKSESQSRKQELALTLVRQVEKYEKEWEVWIDSMSVPGSYYRLGYGEEYL